MIDALKLRSHANGNSSAAPFAHLTTALSGAAEQNHFDLAYGTAGVIDKLAPTVSRGFLGAGLNVLVVGTGAKHAAERQAAFKQGVRELAAQEDWDFGAVYRLTSLTQQVAVFWRAIANAAFKSGTFVLAQATKVAALAPHALAANAAIAKAATTPAGRLVAGLNKWIPLLNAAWVMLAAKTAWDVHRDARSSTMAKTIAAGGVALSVAAVWAGIFASAWSFLGVTLLSIACDLLLVEARHRDRARGDTDALAARWAAHPHEGFAAAGRWVDRIWSVIRERAATVASRLRGERVPRPRVARRRPSRPAPAPAPVTEQPAASGKPFRIRVTG